MKHVPVSRIALWSLFGFVAALQVSIVAAQALLAVVAVCWAAMLASGTARFAAPAFFRPLLVYAVLTLVATVFSVDPRVSFVDDKQLLLFLIVPAVYEIARGPRARTVVHVIITVGAATAVFGIVQYGILHYDNLGQRPQGSMGHYMTYSGLLMLAATAAAARLLFETRDRVWPALVMPALLVALALTFTRSAWVGASVGIASLLLMKDFRLVGALPVLLAIGIAIAPPQVTQRVYSMFNLKDPTSRDRVAMIREGVRMIAADPLTGMGPNMVEREVHPVPRPGGRGARQPAPAQRAPADCRRARAAGPWRLALVRRQRGRGPVGAAPPWAPSVSPRVRPRGPRGHAGGGALRAQLRRFRVPDAPPDPRHAAVCVRASRRFRRGRNLTHGVRL